MSKILFLDFDGVMIPTRSYWLEDQTRPVTKFDPVAVSLVNRLCLKGDIKIVIVSSWRRVAGSFVPEDLRQHLISNGIKEELIHEDHSCPFKFSSSKYHDVTCWLEDHPEVKDYVILDDDLSDEYGHEGKIISPIFEEGVTFSVYLDLAKRFGVKEKILL